MHLYYMLGRRLVREQHARAALQRFAAFGASIHPFDKHDGKKEWILVIPIRRPARRHALWKVLDRNSAGEQFDLVWLESFEGPTYRVISDADLNERGELVDASDVAA